MMATVLSNFLSAELTGLPTWTRTIFNGYYNNALCNGATWMLILWKVLHSLYSRLMYCYLNKIRTKQYMRSMLTNSLWYCGLYGSTLAYCFIAFDGNKMDLLRGNHLTVSEELPTTAILGHIMITTFYIHTALLEGMQGGSGHLFLKYFLLVVLCTSAYILRVLTIPLTLSALIAIYTISEEVTRILYSVLNRDKFTGSLYVFNFVLFIFIHLFIIPLILLIPIGKMLASKANDAILILLFASLLCWLCFAMYNSIISNSIFHWIYHTSNEPSESEDEEIDEKAKQIMRCPGNIIECSLFSTRNDDAYVLHVLRYQMKGRKIEMDAKKKPKTKNQMLIQTLRCMMTIKKKLNQRKKSDNADSVAIDEEIEDKVAIDKVCADDKVVINKECEDDKVVIKKECQDDKIVIDRERGEPKVETQESGNENQYVNEADSEILISCIDMDVATDESNNETIKDCGCDLVTSQHNTPSESTSYTETKVDIVQSTKDHTNTKIESDILCTPGGSLEAFELSPALEYNAGTVKHVKLSSELIHGARNLGNIESGKLLLEADGRSTKMLSTVLDDNSKLNSKTKQQESMALDEIRTMEGDEVNEETFTTGFTKVADGDE